MIVARNVVVVCVVSRYLAGVIPMARLGGFMRLLWFASHGNIFVRHVEIVEPVLDPHTVSAVHTACCLYARWYVYALLI